MTAVENFSVCVKPNVLSLKNCSAQSRFIMLDFTLFVCYLSQSPFHDGKMERWHHANCFFQKQRPKTTGDIAHFDSIRWEDQEYIKKQIGMSQLN